MKTTKLLVIDDRWDERADVYLKVLSPDFEVIPVEKGSQLFEAIDNIDVDAYVIDIVLSKWTDPNDNRKPLQVMTVLEKINNNKPKILVSNEYENLVKDQELTPLINAIIDKGINVNSFLIWSDFMKAYTNPDNNNTKTIQSTIKLDILKNIKFQKKKESDQFDFAVICALGEELEPFLEKFNEIEYTEIENIGLNKGILKTKNGKELKFIAAKQEEMGTVDTAIITSKLISSFKIKHVFMIGVCGGRDGKVGIGDLIIPHEIIAFQRGKIGPTGFELNFGFAKSNGNIKSVVETGSKKLLTKIFVNYSKKLAKTGSLLNIKTPIVHFDEMACGENVINKKGEIDRIAKKTNKPKLCAVDMESFAMYRLCEIMNIKASVIKSVMDLSSNKSDRFKEYAAYVSANFLYSAIYEGIISFDQ